MFKMLQMIKRFMSPVWTFVVYLLIWFLAFGVFASLMFGVDDPEFSTVSTTQDATCLH